MPRGARPALAMHVVSMRLSFYVPRCWIYQIVGPWWFPCVCSWWRSFNHIAYDGDPSGDRCRATIHGVACMATMSSARKCSRAPACRRYAWSNPFHPIRARECLNWCHGAGLFLRRRHLPPNHLMRETPARWTVNLPVFPLRHSPLHRLAAPVIDLVERLRTPARRSLFGGTFISGRIHSGESWAVTPPVLFPQCPPRYRP